MTCPIHRQVGKPVRRSQSSESTNLNRREDVSKEILNGVSSGPCSDDQQHTRSVEGTRLDEHGDDGGAQSADSSYPHRSAGVPGVQRNPDNDHEGEDDVERKRKRIVWNSGPRVGIRCRALVDVHDTHRYIVDVSLKCRRRSVENSNTYPTSQDTRGRERR